MQREEQAGQKAADWREEPEVAVNDAIAAAMSKTDPREAIDALLGSIGASMRADRVYIFELAGHDAVSNTFESCAPGVSSQIAKLQKVPLETMELTWLPRFRAHEAVVIADTEAYAQDDPRVSEMLRAQNIEDLVAIPLFDNEQFLGFIGIDNPEHGVAQGMGAFLEMLSSFTIALLRQRDNVQRLSELSSHDRVSGAFNTLYLLDQLEHGRKEGALAEDSGLEPSELGDLQALAVIHFNLVQFKEFNSAFGMDEGNRCLRDIARVLAEVFGASCVSRYSADHFVVFCGTGGVDGKIRLAHARVRALRPEFKLWLEAGICDPGTSETLEGAVDLAKVACDQIPKDGQSYLRRYTGKLEEELERKKYLQDHVEQAVNEGWLQVWYQPVIRTLTGKLAGVEALSRWQDPVHGSVSPGVFVPALEEKHLSWKLLSFVIDRVCDDLAARRSQGVPVVPVSVNVSRTDFESADPFELITSAVRAHDLPSSLVCVEITESVAMADPDGVEAVVRRFGEAGFEVWMDDFGSAYSSLNTLKDFSFGKLKLDMLFMHNFNQRAKDILASIIDMAKKLGVHTLAEGVETEEQVAFLQDMGCEEIQGFYYSRPLPLADAIEFAKGRPAEPPEERALMNEVGLVRLPEAEACGYVLYTDGVLKLIHANRRLHELAQRYDLVDGKNLENLLNASQGRYAKGYRAAAERVMESEASDVFAFTENGYGFQLLISIAARNGSGCVFLVQLRENPIPLTLDEVAGIESPGLTSGQDGTVVQTAGKSISTNVRIDHTTEDALDTLRALTNIFVTLVNIDLVNWKLQPIVVAEVSRGFLPEGNLDYDEVMPKFLRIGVDVSYREIMRTFLNREDLVGKLSEHGTLAIDYLGANLGWCRLFLIPSHTDGQGRVTKALFAVREVNAEKAETRRMAYGVNHDPLTGAFNRNGLAMVVDMVHGNTNPMAYAILDLDNFKRFNDTFGHKAGDGLLKRVVRLIIDSFGATDYVARIGGDEFVVVLTNYVEDRDGSVIRKRLAWVNAALADSCEEQLDENPDAPRIEMSLSAGIVLSPKGYRDDFYELADEELYQQKGDGKGGSRVLMLEDALQ